jgi:PEP-CTERM motif
MKAQLQLASVSLLAILCLLPGTTALATNLYNNGPTNGTSNAYFIDIFRVSDSFTVSPNASIDGFDIAEWVPAGAIPLAFNWAIGTSSFGSDIGSGVANNGGNATVTLLCTSGPFNGGSCGGGLGYDVYQVDVTGLPSLQCGGSCWLTLTGATDNFGGRDAWDINSGPSLAYQNALGAVCSESFSITGTGTPSGGGGPSSCGGGASTPEPNSMMLFGSGILGLAGVLRRRLMG